jgi:hypothetical protein
MESGGKPRALQNARATFDCAPEVGHVLECVRLAAAFHLARVEPWPLFTTKIAIDR